jgi:hypothetical protein
MLKLVYNCCKSLANQEIKHIMFKLLMARIMFWRQKKMVSLVMIPLTYSFMTTVKYENKTVQVTENLPGKDFAKGLIM